MLLSHLLNIPCLANCRIAAGANGLNRNVHTVNMMDAPDIIDFLKPQELLLTTAFAIKDHPEALEALILNMHHVGCAGLAIKTKRFLTEIPEQAVALADRLHFPIIELPLEHSLGDIVNQSLSYILEKRSDDLRYALDSHRHFTSIVLEGKGIPELIQELTAVLGSPALLLNHKLDLIAHSRQFQAARSTILPMLQQALCTSIPADAKTSFSLSLAAAPPYCHAVIHPIQTYQPQGFLISFMNDTRNNNLPMLAMEQAANVISFELMKHQAVKERSRRYKNDFFSDLVEGFVTSEQEVLHRGKRYGLNERNSSLCIIAKGDPSGETPSSSISSADEHRSSEQEHIYQLMKQQFIENGTTLVLFTKKDLFVAILSFTSNEAALNAMEHKLSPLLKLIAEQIYAQTQIPFSFGIGNPVEKLLDISVTYKEALDALQTGYSSKKQKFVQFYHIKEITDLLRMVPMEELSKFYANTFQAFEHIDEKEQKELTKTLMVYYENHCQIAETAKQLFVHRNTVIYRLEKCQQLIGRSLRSPSDSLRFRIAYLIEPLLK